METEVFSITHDEVQTLEMDQEAINIIEHLGLEGQKKLMGVVADGVKRNPWPILTDEECKVYQAICPVRDIYTKFDKESIPLSVLKEIALAKELDLFGRIEIWSTRSANIDDPLVVGCEKDSDYSPGKLWKIARWGRELYTLAELRDLAIKTTLPRLKAELTKAIAELKSALQVVESGCLTRVDASVHCSVYI